MKSLSIPKKVNSTVVRLVGAQVFLLSVLYIFTGQPLITAFLVLDFGIRAAGYPRFSPTAFAGSRISRGLKLKERPIFFTPKRFAASIGFALSLGALASVLFGAATASALIIAVLALFSFLESGFGFCAGCKIFAFLMGKGWISSEHCRDCVS